MLPKLLLRCLCGGFRVPNHILLSVFDNFCLTDTVRLSLLTVWCRFPVTVTDCLYPSNAEDVERIRVMVLSDDVSDDDSIDDGRGCGGDHVEPRECDTEFADEATSGDNCSNEVDAADSCFLWRGQDEASYSKSSTRFRCRRQNIPTHLPGAIGQARKALRKVELFRYR